MIINSFSAAYRFRRSTSLLFVVVCHVLILAVFVRPVRLQNIVPAYSLMSIFSINQKANENWKVSIEKVNTKSTPHFAESKNKVLKIVEDESSELIGATKSDPPSAEKNKDEGKTISSKELASLDSLARRYNLEVPKIPLEEALTSAQQAAQDPRTNSARLTKSEKFAVALGALDCIFQTRLADGRVIRVPGHWVVIPARSEPGMTSLAKSRFCVRFHQEADEDGNDLTAISAGIRGKL